MIFVMLKGESGQAYNIACESCNVSLTEFAQECAIVAGKSVVRDLPTETETKGYSIANRAVLVTDKLSALGWDASYTFKNAIIRTYNILDGRRDS